MPWPLSANEVRYNPMSYHNGSIWPHDNALIAAGFARYGLKRPVLSILEGLFEASLQVDLRRLPELISGFHREQGGVPTNYPTACAPQAWASGAVFSLLQSTLGLSLDAPNRRVVFYKPALPAWLDWVTIHALRVGDAVADVELVRHHDDDVGTNVVVRSGELEVLIRK